MHPSTHDYQSYPSCQHIMPSGRLCQCPAKKGLPLCINHSRDRQRVRNLAKAREVKNYTNPKRPDFRPEEDLNAEIFESLHFPALEDTAAVNIVIGNAIRLLGGKHLSVRAFEAIVNACRIAEINLRKGNAFFRTEMHPQLVDTDPVTPFSDAEGFVTPEESNLKALHEKAKVECGAEGMNIARARTGLMDHMFDPLAYPGLKRADAAEQAYLDRKKEEEEKEEKKKRLKPPLVKQTA